LNILFYGASVTQQNIDLNGNEVGFVPAFKKLAANLPELDLTIHQRGYGGVHLNDAGLIYLTDAIKLDPDVVFLDWHSTAINIFDERIYSYIQRTLLAKHIKVINLIVPRRSCIGKPERPNILQARGYQQEGSRFLNLYDYLGNEIDISLCTRDEVHTTPTGAKVYAKIIFDFLLKLLNSDRLLDKGKSSPPPKNLFSFNVNSFDLRCEINEQNKLYIEVEQGSKIQLFADVLVGPFTPILDIICGGCFSLSLMDSWCYYERKCLKELSTKFTATEGRVEIRISSKKPDYCQLKKTIQHDNQSLRLPIYKLYCIGSKIINASISD
jgi:hypothetical protein